MMQRRWYRRCGADFIHGTMSLTLEEKGAYSLCLDLIYDRGGPIPDDERWLAGICGVSTRKWRTLRVSLIAAGKLSEKDGHLTNARAQLELVSDETRARNQAESGAKGGRKRVENASRSNESNDLGQGSLKHKREEKRREEGSVSNDTAARPPPDLDTVLFTDGLAFLASKGVPEGRRRPLIGKWRSEHGTGRTVEAISAAQREGAIEPVAFIERCLRSARQREGAERERLPH